MDTLTTGLSQGDFTALRVLSNGAMTDILKMIGSGGAGITTIVGAGAAVVNGTGSSRTITVDLSAYATTVTVNTLLANYVLASAYNTAMAAKIDTLTAGANITITIHRQRYISHHHGHRRLLSRTAAGRCHPIWDDYTQLYRQQCQFCQQRP